MKYAINLKLNYPYRSLVLSKVIIIGSGFSGLASACYMAKTGCDVTIIEKNQTIGGRARQFEKDGFLFDMGPTFYWMPDIFENFFNDFNKRTTDYYSLLRLDPGYQIYFDHGNDLKQNSDLEILKDTFDSAEKGSGAKLERFLKSAEYNYRVAIDKVVYKPGKSALELLMPETIFRAPQFLASLSGTVKKNFKNPQLRQMLEFPVLFLGAKPSATPSFYRFMNYADMVLGSWHVDGGMFSVVKAMEKLAKSMGVKVVTGYEVTGFGITEGKVEKVLTEDSSYECDAVISGADYQHTESLLPLRLRNYSDIYWRKRMFAPSAILYYVAFGKKIKNVSHHTLFFDTSFDEHASKIYDKKGWPEKPLFYASFPSKTDAHMAPEGKECAIFLIPTATGLTEDENIIQNYFEQIIRRMEKITKQDLKEHIVFCRSYSGRDFIRDYNAYDGNAYGLANTLSQTAFLKPKIYNRKIRNLFYTGQLTVPGPGVPTALISGKIAAECAHDYLKSIANPSI